MLRVLSRPGMITLLILDLHCLNGLEQTSGPHGAESATEIICILHGGKKQTTMSY